MKIAVIGNGIVGSTFINAYLKDFNDTKIVQFDQIKGTATTASAGIIAPWLSKRRNKKWYKLACLGAEYLKKLAEENNIPSDVYDNCGVIYTRDTSDKLNELETLAEDRREKAPQIGSIERLNAADIEKMYPFIKTSHMGLFVKGGARIDGRRFVDFLNQGYKDQVEFRNELAHVTYEQDRVYVNHEEFDYIVLATGAWLNQTIEDTGLVADVSPQKGQLIEVSLPESHHVEEHLPVLMPEGERDFIPTNEDTLLIGATHENDEGFDLEVSSQVKDDLLASGQRIIDNLSEDLIKDVRVGTRSYTKDFSPFFGFLPNSNKVLVASGLGSSGLTTGPIIGKLLVDLIQNPKVDISDMTNPVTDYIH